MNHPNKVFHRFIIMAVLALAGIADMYAQKLRVDRFVIDKTDVSAQARPRRDLNGELCALVKVEIASSKAEFSGDIVAPAPEYKMGKYWVYMTGKDPEARYIEIYVPGYLPLNLDFAKFSNIGSLKSGSTYLLTIEMPGAHPYAIQNETPQPTNSPSPQPTKPQGNNTNYSKFTTPKNLYLACEREGQYFYFSETDWRNLPAAEQLRFDKKGVVVIGDGERFILDLHDSGDGMTWEEAMRRYGNRLPTKSQAQVMDNNYMAINKAIIAFGGDDPEWGHWTRTEYDSSHAWCVNMNYGGVYNHYKTSTYRVRAVAPVLLPSSAM